MTRKLAVITSYSIHYTKLYDAGSAVCQAADKVLEALLPVAAVQLGCRAEQLAVGGGEIYSVFETEKRIDFWEAVEKYIDAHGPLTATGDYTPPRRTAKFKGGNIGLV